MIVDASALIAVVLGEEDHRDHARMLKRSRESTISAVNYVEAGIRADRGGPERGQLLDEILRRFDVRIAGVTTEQSHAAREAYRRFGKGRHPARLNLGDCFAFALAKTRGEPLLFKGSDFAHPDVLAEIGSAL